jgi:hypothetical protein
MVLREKSPIRTVFMSREYFRMNTLDLLDVYY